MAFLFMRKNKTKSPLKDNPLRMPGQSLDNQLNKIIDEEVLFYLVLPAFLILFTIWNWLLWYQVIPIPNPIIMTVFTIAASIYVFIKMVKARRKIKAYRLGIDGERAVGQTLETLRSSSYKIFHDLIGEGFNIDHLIVSKHGIYSIETKTYSKPQKGECRIKVTSDGISVNGYQSDQEILNQAKAQKSWLERKIKKNIGSSYPVKPVVVFPGWYIEDNRKIKDVWVLEPKALPKYIQNDPEVLTEKQVREISNSFSQLIRSTYNQ